MKRNREKSQDREGQRERGGSCGEGGRVPIALFCGVCGTLCWTAGCWDAAVGKGALPGNMALKESVEQP